MVIDLMTAIGEELDAAGIIHGNVRHHGESDENFRSRLIRGVPVDGGPAFPQQETVGMISTCKGGMTLRDYFAAKAAQGSTAILADVAMEEGERIIGMIAKVSYMLADAMLAERAK